MLECTTRPVFSVEATDLPPRTPRGQVVDSGRSGRGSGGAASSLLSAALPRHCCRLVGSYVVSAAQPSLVSSSSLGTCPCFGGAVRPSYALPRPAPRPSLPHVHARTRVMGPALLPRSAEAIGVAGAVHLRANGPRPAVCVDSRARAVGPVVWLACN